MLAFMTKTLASVNEDLKAGKTVVVTVAGQNAAPLQPASEENAPDVHAVTTATFESAMHRIPLPAAGKTRRRRSSRLPGKQFFPGWSKTSRCKACEILEE